MVYGRTIYIYVCSCLYEPEVLKLVSRLTLWAYAQLRPVGWLEPESDTDSKLYTLCPCTYPQLPDCHTHCHVQ